MVIGYLLVLTTLAILYAYSSRKASKLEEKVELASEATRSALATISLLQGNANRPDGNSESRHRRKIDAAVEKLQVLEDRCEWWQHRAECLRTGFTRLFRRRRRGFRRG